MGDRFLTIPTETTTLSARLFLPERARGLLLFAHGSDAVRHAERDLTLLRAMGGRDLGVASVELLAGMHAGSDLDQAARRHAMHVLTQRLVSTCDWLRAWPATADLPLALFGVELGAGAALCASVARAGQIQAVVCWNGQLDLVGNDLLRRVRTPTLFLLDGDDEFARQSADVAEAHVTAVHEVRILTRQAWSRSDLNGHVANLGHAFVEAQLRAQESFSLAHDGARSI